VGAKIKSFSQR